MANLNAMAPVADIQTYADFVNDKIAGGAAVNPETFYSKQLLDTIRIDVSEYCYFRLADSFPIQDKADKLSIRRWSSLQGHTTPLAEGIPPMSDRGSVIKYELEAFQYGRYMEFTDQVDFKVVDPVVSHFAKEYSIVAVETLDLLARDALLLSSQKYFAGGALSYDGLTFVNGKPNITDLRKIVMSMTKQLVKPRNNGKFQVIGSADFYYDLFNDTLVQQFMTVNQTTKTMFDGGRAPIVPMFGMEFYETQVVPTSGEYVDAGGHKRLKVYTGIPGAAAVISTAAGVTLADLIETDATQYTVADGFAKDKITGKDASYIPGMVTWNTTAADDPTAKEFKVEHVLVVGKDALARTGLAGQDSAKMYVKALGSSGTLDPIDQRQSIGFKINSVGFGSIRPEAVVDYICVPSMTNL